MMPEPTSTYPAGSLYLGAPGTEMNIHAFYRLPSTEGQNYECYYALCMYMKSSGHRLFDHTNVGGKESVTCVDCLGWIHG